MKNILIVPVSRTVSGTGRISGNVYELVKNTYKIGKCILVLEISTHKQRISRFSLRRTRGH
jgi:hypothetical protein